MCARLEVRPPHARSVPRLRFCFQLSPVYSLHERDTFSVGFSIVKCGISYYCDTLQGIKALTRLALLLT